MILEITIATIASTASIITPVLLWWRSRKWRSLSRREELRGQELLINIDELDDYSTNYQIDMMAVDYVLSETALSALVGSSGPATTSTVANFVQRPVKSDEDVFDGGRYILRQGSGYNSPKKIMKRLTDQNHMKMAKKLADKCRMTVTVGDYTEANKLVVIQWLKNELRQIPNRRDAHCLKIISLALVIVFTPTRDEVETSALMNTRALLERRHDYKMAKISRLGGIFGWFTGYQRIEEPSGAR